jgi:predicted RNA-binding Zn-ribbon protein involved in translation (DUF1610 family)
MENLNYNTREQWINAFINAARPFFNEAGFPLPLNIRAGVGFPIEGYRSKAIGQIIYPEGSADRHYEIFLNPKKRDTDSDMPDARLADILTHELCHAAADHNHGFRNHGRATSPFGQVCSAVGLEGPLKGTYGGSNWFHWAAPVLTELGPMPYASIDLSSQYTKKKTYGVKLECPDCGWLARVSKKHVLAHAYLTCPVPDCGSIMIAHTDEEESD